MIKAFDPQSTLGVVWPGDPAVNKGATLTDGLLSLCAEDPAKARAAIVIRDGCTPTEWILGVVPPARLNEAEDMHGHAARFWLCFLHGVRAIKNAGELTAGLKDRRPPTVTVEGVEYVSPEWLAQVMIGPLRRCALDLGLIVWVWNNLQEDDAKNSSAPSSPSTSLATPAPSAQST